MKTIAAGIFLVRKDGKILICHPTNHSPTLWSIPKGKVEEGETHIETALRETQEETNLDVSSIYFTVYELDSVTYKSRKKRLHPFVFIENEDSRFDWAKEEIKCMSNVPEDRGGFPEMDMFQWCSFEECMELLHDTQVECIPKVKELFETKTHLTVF